MVFLSLSPCLLTVMSKKDYQATNAVSKLSQRHDSLEVRTYFSVSSMHFQRWYGRINKVFSVEIENRWYTNFPALPSSRFFFIFPGKHSSCCSQAFSSSWTTLFLSVLGSFRKNIHQRSGESKNDLTASGWTSDERARELVLGK